MPTCPPLYVPAPPVQPYTFGLFSVAVMPPPHSDPHWQCGVMYEPYRCGVSQTVGDYCDPDELPPDKQVPEGVPLVEADPITVFDGFRCKIVGRTAGDIMDRARQALALGEQRAVEEAYWTGSAGNSPRLADPSAVVLNAVASPTAAEALSPVAGIAALETYLAATYGGVGVIHGPRGAVPVLAAHRQLNTDRTGSRLSTWLGTAFAAGGGYAGTGPDGAAAPAGTMWLYATGTVVVRRSDVWVNPDSVQQALTLRTNEVTLLAERTYVVSHECALAAVLISTGGETP